MSKDEIEYNFPWGPAGLLLGVFLLGVLMEYLNWTPFW